MKKLNKKGFSIVEVVIVIVVLGLIGGLGWYIGSKQNKKGNTSTNTGSSSQNKTTDTTETKNETNYLTIKEWGIKVPMLPKGNELFYEMAESETSATIVSKEQRALGGSCGQFNFARTYILREPKGGKSDDSFIQARIDSAIQQDDFVTVGNFTYYFIGDMSGGVCNDKIQTSGQSVSDEERLANANIYTSLKGIVAAE